MDKASSKTFIELYNINCRKNQTKSKIHFLNNDHLEINADRFEKEDWKPLIKALKSECNNLHSIVVRSNFSSKEKYQKSRQSITEPAFLKENLTSIILQAIKDCVKNSQLMSLLYLEGFPVSNYIQILNDCIILQKNLQHLALPNCYLTNQDITLLCQSICKHTGLWSIDLSGCGITSIGAKEISVLIRRQKLARYGETWKQTLRYRLPKPDILPGLKRIILNNNISIGDDGFKLIVYELMDDLWIKAIDLQNCGLTNSSIEDIFNLLKINLTIKILDVRKNNLPDNIIKNVINHFKKNTTDPDDKSYCWMNNTPSSTISLISNIKKNNNPYFSSSVGNASNSKTSQIISSRKLLSNPFNNQIQTNSVLSKSNETKFKLCKVSGRLIDEKIKTERIEKKHGKFKGEEEIQNCLKQGKKISRIDSCVKSSGAFKPTNGESFDKGEVKKNVRLSNRDKVNTTFRETCSYNYSSGSDNYYSLSPKLLLLIPAAQIKCTQFTKTNKKLKRSKSGTKKRTKHHVNRKVDVKGELQMDKKILKSTIAFK